VESMIDRKIAGLSWSREYLPGVESLQVVSPAISIGEILRAAFQPAPADYWAPIRQGAGIAAAQPNAI